ncbi:protein N-terminal glutamine amidohydrolase-like [Portunus trituberculatus]|uniref:protein N-terminal glutamine amidohydrolase-like n=1 Tax=Portunus trituberculatus TaxID=210409 RepID=UPI001E1CB52D|nr:protein N-terminal glutamine amidohydrolase-like [Portunus trituberculatus]XP_045116734.1 protein N-terminal glutamine amidohydrolase-like [Portunus trituberculatus]XP_045116735.1 protein N-terminal glutamine amidohydrolase-like [Portunus trituberculatus]XP_045116736.1 protein N-terminal glutamine amidohydrolase-like [Portunus trituberculatus]XP_045116737.1 protein N-terminal glutamine amidohydrolase-like [Portunus trituberculatus]XP_045116738.1 protein N-terminal glutamine amidohydrolase-l
MMAAQTQTAATTDSPSRRAVPKTVKTVVPAIEDCAYTQFYCEENVWRLCEYVRTHEAQELAKCFVAFISNDSRCVPLWRQRMGKSEDKLITWDYHVIFMYEPDERCLVFDLDSDLPFPTYFHKYVTETLRTDHILRPEHYRYFRVVPAATFLQKFASDRRHMRREDGSWMHPPPPSPPIALSECVHNLDDFISMDAKRGVGTVYNLQDFVRRFYKNM